MCYAYKDSEKEEDLIEHLITTANICSERWELKALALKTSKLLNIDVKKVEEAVILASMLHDIGKAAEIYQSACSANKCVEFPGHYLISTFITHLTFNINNVNIGEEDIKKFLADDINSLGEDKIYAMLVVLPVALHHYHQVRGFRSYSTSESMTVLQFLENPKMCVECLKEVKNMLSYERVGQSGRKLLEHLDAVLRNIEYYADKDVYRSSKIFIQNFYNVMEEDLKRFAEYPITLGKILIESVYGLINLCDGFAASIKRR